MIKVYLFKYKEYVETSFSKAMSSKYKNNHKHDVSGYAYSKLESILLNDFNYAIDIDNIYYNENKKPFIKDSDLFFNISHSNDYVLIAISDSEVGVDIEATIKEIKANSLIKKLFVSDIKHYNNLTETEIKERYITELWVRKEALGKQLGIGLNFRLLSGPLCHREYNLRCYYSEEKKTNYYISVVNRNNERIDEIIYNNQNWKTKRSI